MRTLVLGGDGFCGWATALHLRANGHEVVVADDFSRRLIETELGAPSLTPIEEPAVRSQISGIRYILIDIAKEHHRVSKLIEQFDAVVHFAEQRAAPYSMKSLHHRRYTVVRNMASAINVVNALADNPHVHLIHLGTAGVYGYSGDGSDTPEGWIDWKGERRLHPFKPGSIYHATKCMDATLFEFCARNDGLMITDLHQGIVWGTQTDETEGPLINRFDWDGDYGTVLNRFLVQAALSHPLTVHGSGGQTRGFIHIRDTVKCVRLALENPPARGQYRVFNQSAECLRVKDLADRVADLTGAEIMSVPNPRIEADSNELGMVNEGLLNLGWEPARLRDDYLLQEVQLAHDHRARVSPQAIPCVSRW